MASMWQNEAEWPNISMYIAMIRYSFRRRAEIPFSDSLGFNVLSSFRMMRSYSCLDFVSPMLFISSCSSLDKLELLIWLDLINKII